MPRHVYITLDRERRLRFTIEALERLEGRGFNVRQALLGEKRITATVALMFEGLRHEDPKLTLEQTRALMQIAVDNGTPIQSFYDQAVEALNASGIFATEESGKDPSTNGGEATDAAPPAAEETVDQTTTA